MNTDQQNLLAEHAVIDLGGGQRFIAEAWSPSETGLFIVASGDWERTVELIGAPTVHYMFPLASIKHIRLFTVESTAVEVTDEEEQA